MRKDAKIYVAGHRGLVGSAIVEELKRNSYKNIITRTHKELDLTHQDHVAKFFKEQKPEYVFLAAAKVGGIHANNVYRAEFIYQNLMMQSNIIHQAYMNGVQHLLFLGSSCIYPKLCPQPIKEEYLLTGLLEPTNSPYAVAKIAGIEMCWAYNMQYGTQYIPVMPTNLYGPNDNFNLETSHVLPALIRKFHKAKENGDDSATVWGTGSPRREFLHVDDMATACVFLMAADESVFNDFSSEKRNLLFNIGSGKDVSIKELAHLVAEAVGFSGELTFDTSKPDGTPQKLLDISQLRSLGWAPAIELSDGIQRTYEWYKSTCIK